MENKDTNVLIDEVIIETCEWIKEQLKTTQAQSESSIPATINALAFLLNHKSITR
ncbi:MAG: hypothetical protein ACK5L6_13390 [Anaerorhabdus sp.]|uniref:hypothetical protein n=1 Tax=Anaerorhabdus sp. TaxID=1872524 RepID=UPI003A8A94FF